MRLITNDDPFYHMPVYEIASLDEFNPVRGEPEQIYSLKIGDGMTLAFLTNIPAQTAHDDIRVGLHSAKGIQISDGHYFAPLDVARRSGSAYVLFSDPTLTLEPTNRLSWFVGTPNVNPDEWMEAIIRKLMRASGANYVIFEGSSSGGFVALRLSTRFGNSVAISRIPQTDVFRYDIQRQVKFTLDAAWRGLSYAEVMQGYAHRFRPIDLYTDPAWNRGNLVSYIHNPGDTTHTVDHLNPFLAEIGVDSDAYLALNGRVAISRPFVGMGHVGIPASFWAPEAELALRRLKELKPMDASAEPEPMFSEPAGFNRPAEIQEMRTVAVAKHFLNR